MSYLSDNISLIRANNSPDIYSADVTENTVDAYANLFFPHILDNGGKNSNQISLTIDILNKEDLEAETSELPNKNWVNEDRCANNLIVSKAIWGIKETYHGVKKSRAISNAFCFGGQKFNFYIAPQGHSVGQINGQWVYAKTSLTVEAMDLGSNTIDTLHTFDSFESSEDDSFRTFSWTVPDIKNDLFTRYGLFGIIVLKLEIQYTYYEDGNFERVLEGNFPNKNQSTLQLLIYSGTKEIREVDAGNLDILTSLPPSDASLSEIFDYTIFDAISDLNQNPLSDDQKRAIIADQIAFLFISQHPTVNADFYPAKIIGGGGEEAIAPVKIIQKAITYSKKYPEIIPLVKSRLFGMFAAYKAYSFTTDINAEIPDYQQSAQKLRDPARTILIDKDNVVTHDLGINGLIFNPYLAEVLNAEPVFKTAPSLVVDIPLRNTLVDISSISITDSAGNPLLPLATRVKISFDLAYGSDKISEVRYVLFSRDSRNRKEYVDATGTTTSHIFELGTNTPVVLHPGRSGDIVDVRIDIKDIESKVSSFYASIFVQGSTDKPSIRNLEVYQRDDGSDVVDIEYTYDGLGEINVSYLTVQYSLDKGEVWLVTPEESLRGDFGNNIVSGRKHIAWIPDKDTTSLTSGQVIMFKLVLLDADGLSGLGQTLTGSLVWNIVKPNAAVRRLTLQEQEDMFISSSSSSSSSTTSSSSSSIDSSSSSSLSTISSASTSSSSSTSFSGSSSSSISSSSSSIDSSSTSSSSSGGEPPSDDLFMWYDADDEDTVIVDAFDGVETWTDKSGNNNDLTWATVVGGKPLYVGNVFGTKSAIRFGGQKHLNLSLSPISLNGITVFVVYKNFDPSLLYLISFNPPQPNAWYLYSSINGLSVSCIDANNLRTPTMHTSNSFPANTNLLLTVRESTSLIEYWKNGVFDGSTGVTVPSPIQAGLVRVGDNASFYSINGYIAEMLVYNKPIPDGRRQAVETYLINKWGL